jgi:CBS domain-containing protein
VDVSRRTVEEILKETPLARIAREEPVSVGRQLPAGDVIATMRKAGAGVALVVEADGRLIGIFTERDHLDKLALPEVRARLGFGLDTPIEQLMTSAPRVLPPEGLLADALRLMTEGGYRHIPLVRPDGRVAGLVSASDVVTFIAEHFPAEVFNLPPRFGERIRTREGG